MVGEELRARTRQFAIDVVELCVQLGKDDLGRLVRPQLLRAGTGVAANHRAASQSRSRREFIGRLSIVIEEADEAELRLDLLETRHYGPLDLVKSLRREAHELRRIFGASRATAMANQGKPPG